MQIISPILWAYLKIDFLKLLLEAIHEIYQYSIVFKKL